MQKKPGDVVVVRVSEQGDREDENFHSPKAQLARAKSWSKDQGNRVVDAFEEIDVSGKLPLARRPGLLKAIEMVEAGEADHIVVAYFDRLVRSLKVQLEVIERVEQAGGETAGCPGGFAFSARHVRWRASRSAESTSERSERSDATTHSPTTISFTRSRRTTNRGRRV
jgi:DNA invertase Pin-like site-specific DNA recombinase